VGSGMHRGRQGLKVPSWLQEALARRVLSGGRGPPVPGGGQEWWGLQWGSHQWRSLFGLCWEKFCSSGAAERWVEQLVIPKEGARGPTSHSQAICPGR
jgi:hypothetical protein